MLPVLSIPTMINSFISLGDSDSLIGGVWSDHEMGWNLLCVGDGKLSHGHLNC